MILLFFRLRGSMKRGAVPLPPMPTMQRKAKNWLYLIRNRNKESKILYETERSFYVLYRFSFALYVLLLFDPGGPVKVQPML